MPDLSPGKYYLEVECAGLNADGGGLAVIGIEPTTDGRIITQVDPSRLRPVPEWEYGAQWPDGDTYPQRRDEEVAVNYALRNQDGIVPVRRRLAGSWERLPNA